MVIGGSVRLDEGGGEGEKVEEVLEGEMVEG
jgi:hypothetical protein